MFDLIVAVNMNARRLRGNTAILAEANQLYGIRPNVGLIGKYRSILHKKYPYPPDTTRDFDYCDLDMSIIDRKIDIPVFNIK